MAYHYGSDSPEISNPFKQEGLYYLISGLIILIIGIISLITLREQIIENGLTVGWFNLTMSLLLMSAGATFLFKGFNKRARFLVGRGAPSSLSKNLARGESHTSENNTYYNSGQVEQMMVGRKNPTFREPVTLFDRVVYSFYPKFIFLPYAMRNYLHILIQKASYSFIALIIYFIALLSGQVGLTLLTESSFSEWLGIALCVFLIFTWVGKPLTLKNVTDKELKLGRNSKIVWILALVILIPSLAELALRQGISIPPAFFNPTFALIIFYVLIILVSIVGILLANYRAKMVHPNTEVSEYRDHWQENVHPRDFFRALDMEMANLRYREIPNRVYRELNPTLNMEGSMDKGSFTGDTIQETQPIYLDVDYPESLKKFRLIGTILGHCLIVLAALLLLINGKPEQLNVASLFSVLYYPSILALFGSSLLTIAHVYWGEIQFVSHLIQFQGEGTYSESKLSVGSAITDSTKSENTFVRTSFSPWVIMSKVITSTQAKAGANALGNARYVLSMDKADDVMNDLIVKMNEFLDEKELVALTTSPKDAKNIEAIYALNDAQANRDKLKLPGKEEPKMLEESKE